MKEVWVSIRKLCDKDNIVFPTKTFIIINSKIDEDQIKEDDGAVN